MKQTHEVEHEGRVMRHEITTTASPARVWSAWTDPERLSEWLTDRATGRASPGFDYTWIWDWCGMTVPFRVAVAERDSRLVLESETREAPGLLIEITLSVRDGRTVVNLVASGFGETADWDEEYEGTNAGWHSMLAVLRKYVENHYATPRSTFTAVRSADVAIARAVPEWFTGAGLGRWLVERGAIGGEGSAFALELKDGGTMTGSVLAIGSREVQLSWNEINGIVGLMVMPGKSDEPLLCINGGGWGLSPVAATALGEQFGRSLDRLIAQL